MMFEDREFDPYLDVRDLAAPPELDDADWAMAVFDPNSGEWLDAT